MLQELADGASCMFDTALLWVWNWLMQHLCAMVVAYCFILSIVWGGWRLLRYFFGILKR